MARKAPLTRSHKCLRPYPFTSTIRYMLMVIFGAGASYDSATRFPPGINDDARPPLAADLFSYRFDNIVVRHPVCQPLFPTLRRSKSVEQELERISAEVERYPSDLPRLLALRYYLQEIVMSAEDRWRPRHVGVNNYLDLLAIIERWQNDHNNEPALFVTFNYDTILDVAFESVFGRQLSDIGSYISHPTNTIIKVHGSTNWLRLVNGQVQGTTGHTSRSELELVVPRLADLEWTNSYVTTQQPPRLERGSAYVPAIAIPTVKKTNFECPDSHLEALKAALPEVTLLLVIGWRGMEEHFLSLCKGNMPNLVQMLIVSGSQKDAKETEENIMHTTGFPGIHTSYSDHGFTHFLLREDEPLANFLWSTRPPK